MSILGKYEAILKIAQYGNLTRAAQELGYVQSNLSHIVQRLESDLQIKIFHRDRQGVTLTRAGQELIEIMYKIEILEASLFSAALSQRTSTLRIGTFPSVSIHWVPHILSKFYQKFPDTAVVITTLNTYADMDMAVRNGEVDCTFYAGDYHAGLDFFPLYRDPYYAVVSQDHPLATRTSITLQELGEYPFLVLGEGIHCSIKDAARLIPFPPKLMTKAQEDLTILPLVELNLGVSVLTGLTVKAGTSQVCAIPLEDILAREVGILCKPYGEISDVAKCFIQIAREVITDWNNPKGNE
jgi:DNA-binding transcriptional LysR family regulator